mmetsp:Transcript_25503/g.39152  ORF Transcript_25503/g.39152 Transcript_25503/m.39152 type:complete len:95 (+) Transcript_25503:220-504(+)
MIAIMFRTTMFGNISWYLFKNESITNNRFHWWYNDIVWLPPTCRHSTSCSPFLLYLKLLCLMSYSKSCAHSSFRMELMNHMHTTVFDPLGEAKR